jgi:biotin transport system substrate-specific component
MQTSQSTKLRSLVLTGVMAAVICVVAPWSIAIGEVPITLTQLAIYLTLFVLGWKRGTISCLVFLLLGAFGLPVFSGFSGGLGKILGPTGGYLLGYLPMCVLAGLGIDKFRNPILQALAMIVGTAVCYFFGTAWYCIQGSHPVAYALGICVFPFIPFDLAKIVLSVAVGNLLRHRLHDAGVLEQAAA